MKSEKKVEKKSEEGSRKPTGKRIQSIERAADILDLFIAHKDPLGISDLARLLSLPKTTVQGIVQTMEARDLLERDPRSSRYRLGPKLFQLGMKYATNMDLVAVVGVWMERLSFQFRVPVNVGMLLDSRVIIVLRVEHEKESRAFPQPGSVIPLHTSAMGKSILGFMDQDIRTPIVEGIDFRPLTKNSLTSALEFENELKEVQASGVSFDREENMPGLAGVGGPLFNHTNQVIAGFALSGSADIIQAHNEEIVQAVRYTSREASRQLGATEVKIFA